MGADGEQPQRRPGLRAWLMPVLAMSLLAWVMHSKGGIGILKKVFDDLGWQVLYLLIPWSVIALITILAYRTALPGRGRRIPFLTLVQVERSGSALNALLPLGNNSSHIIKVKVLRHWYPSESITSAGVWCALASGNANAFGAIGPLVALAIGFGEPWVVGLLAGTAVLMSLPTLTILALVRRGLAARVAAIISKIPLGFVAKRRDKSLAWAKRLDTHMAAAVGERRGDYLRLIGFRFAGQFVRILELWLVVELLGLPGGILTAVLYNATSRAVEQLTPFIPGRLGVMEGVQYAVFGELGLTSEAGLAMALTLRFRYIVNLLVSYTALTRVDAMSHRFPPRKFGPDGEVLEETETSPESKAETSTVAVDENTGGDDGSA